jgi:lipid-A-disaccharide synthase
MTDSGPRVAMVAGEASGDILGSRVIRALRQCYPNLTVEGIGGPLMQAEGMVSHFPLERLAVMGFVDPLKRLPELLGIRSNLKHRYRDDPPDLFLGIDAPDFNLRLERRLREAGVRTAHLVSPTIWAWRPGRIKKIRRAVDLMLCLFPFEPAIYADAGVRALFVGHPLADEIEPGLQTGPARSLLAIPEDGPVLGVLPGSRGGEVERVGPEFLAAAARLQAENPMLRVLLPCASPERRAQIETLLAQYPGLCATLVDGRSREVMAASDVLLLASGTAALEAMLSERPMVVAYRMSGLSWSLVRRMAITKFASLPNILAGRAVVPELLQEALTPDALVAALRPLLAGDRSQLESFRSINATLRQDFATEVSAALAQLLEARLPESQDG